MSHGTMIRAILAVPKCPSYTVLSMLEGVARQPTYWPEGA